MSKQLFPSPNDPQIAFAPIELSALPYFCLTRKGEQRHQAIKFSGLDEAKRPFHWEVHPNSYGLPGEAAWEVWQILIQPRLHSHQPLKHGMVIPLGGVRECLHSLGWTIGGGTAKVLLNALRQIAGATIEFDVWLPLLQPGPMGETYRRVRGSGPRIIFYSIGEYRFGEEETKIEELPTHYELNDVVSIRVVLEADLQQNIQYRPLDLAYAHSVSPSARRFYELTIGSVFGAVSHPVSPGYFELSYSWYVARHHTLQPQGDLRRIKMQMEKVVKDHLKSKYLAKVEYIKRQGSQEVFIRCYPGVAAQQSISRVQSLLAGRRGLIVVGTETAKSATSKEANELVQTLVEKFGVIERIARHLVAQNEAKVADQIAAFPYRGAKADNLAAYIVKAIQDDWSLPRKYLEKQKQKKRERAEILQQEAEQARFDRYEALYQNYLEERLSEIEKAAPEIWAAFIEDTTIRRGYMADSCDSDTRAIAEDWEKTKRYNALMYFGYKKEYPIYSFNDWFESQEGKSMAAQQR